MLGHARARRKGSPRSGKRLVGRDLLHVIAVRVAVCRRRFAAIIVVCSFSRCLAVHDLMLPGQEVLFQKQRQSRCELEVVCSTPEMTHTFRFHQNLDKETTCDTPCLFSLLVCAWIFLWTRPQVSTQSPGPDVSSRRGRFCNTRRIFGALPVRAESQRHQILTKLGVGGALSSSFHPLVSLLGGRNYAGIS